MIKANELRAGNLIFKDGIPIEVDGLIIAFIQAEMVTAKSYSGIPITEEWLQKFKFNLSDCSIKIFQSEKNDWEWGKLILTANGAEPEYYSPIIIQSYSSIDGEVSTDSVYLYHDLHFIHQLQNLYYTLTQSELK